VQLRSPRKDETPEIRLGGIPPSLRVQARIGLSTLSNPAFMSKNREDTLSLGLCRVFTSLKRVMTASYVLSPGREPHWLGSSKPLELAARRRREAIILSRIFEKVQIRTIILKDVGDSLEGFPGLSSTIPFDPLSEAG